MPLPVDSHHLLGQGDKPQQLETRPQQRVCSHARAAQHSEQQQQLMCSTQLPGRQLRALLVRARGAAIPAVLSDVILEQAPHTAIPITHQDAPEPPHHPSRRVSEPHHPSRPVEDARELAPRRIRARIRGNMSSHILKIIRYLSINIDSLLLTRSFRAQPFGNLSITKLALPTFFF